MDSLILRTATRVIAPLMAVLSVFLLLRGHDEPGGGFIGGLVAATAFALVTIAFGPRTARRMLRVDPRRLIAAGLLLALAGGLSALPAGLPFLTGIWTEVGIADHQIKIGTPLLFDLGVYLVVVGVTLTMVLAVEEED